MELGVKAGRKWRRLLAWLWSSAMDPNAPQVIESLPGDRSAMRPQAPVDTAGMTTRINTNSPIQLANIAEHVEAAAADHRPEEQA